MRLLNYETLHRLQSLLLARPMKTIQIIDRRRGFVNLIVDDADYEQVLALSRITIYLKLKGDVYCKTIGYERSLAVELLGQPPPGFVVDHENRDKLDFRRTNLRIVSFSTQANNKGLRKDNKTGFKGVQYDPRTETFIACYNIKPKPLLSYGHKTARDAALAYDNFIIQYQPMAPTNASLNLL